MLNLYCLDVMIIGCILPQDEEPLYPDLKALSIDWDHSDVKTVFDNRRVFHFYLDQTRNTPYNHLDTNGKSGGINNNNNNNNNKSYDQTKKSIPLRECLSLYTSVEKLSHENKW